MKRKKIQKKLLWGILIMAVGLMLVTLLSVCWLYVIYTVEDLTQRAYSYTKVAADLIDGDKISYYLNEQQQDEYYVKIQDYMNSIQTDTDVRYSYVYVPKEDCLVYIWDANTQAGANPLGYEEEYMKDGKERSFSVMKHDPPEELFITMDKTYGYIATACSPIFDSEGNAVALVAVDLSMDKIIHRLRMYILMILIGIAGVFGIGISIFYQYTNKSVILPINQLDELARKMTDSIDSDIAIEPDIHTGDEFESLADTFSAMQTELRDYIRENAKITAEKERIGAELDVATQIQADMLPKVFPVFSDRKEFSIYATMTPAKEVGGDFYDFFFVDNDHLALVMADVSGKGVPAALFMVIAKTLIKNRAKVGISPAQVLADSNEELCEGNEAELFVTVWLAIIDINTGKGIAANAGHEHPAIRRGDGEWELVVYKHSPPVATIEGIRFREHEFELNPGDCLYVYTDGIAEATNKDTEMYGVDRMLCALNKEALKEPKGLLENVKKDIDEFVGEAPQFDDITMLAFEYNGKNVSGVEE